MMTKLVYYVHTVQAILFFILLRGKETKTYFVFYIAGCWTSSFPTVSVQHMVRFSSEQHGSTGQMSPPSTPPIL